MVAPLSKPPSTNNFVTVDGLRIRYVDEGDGPPVVLLHGGSLGSSADIFQRNMKPLASGGLRVVAFDQPGYGLSDIPRDHSALYRRELIPKFVDALGLGRVSLVGHSNLGNAAVALALKNPERYSNVVVLGTGSLLPPLADGQAQRPPPFLVERAKIKSEPTLEQTHALMESYLYHHELITEEEVALRHRHSIGRNFEAFLARKRVAASGIKPVKGASWQHLAELQMPLLMIYGRDDRGGAEQRVQLLRERYPGVNLHLVDNCKHLLPWDAADAYVRLTVSFLTQ